MPKLDIEAIRKRVEAMESALHAIMGLGHSEDDAYFRSEDFGSAQYIADCALAGEPLAEGYRERAVKGVERADALRRFVKVEAENLRLRKRAKKAKEKAQELEAQLTAARGSMAGAALVAYIFDILAQGGVTKWIPVSERLPEEADMVWVYNSGDAVAALFLDNGKGPVWYKRENMPVSFRVEWWMPRVALDRPFPVGAPGSET